MTDSEWLAAAFEEQRDHLRAVAYRLLGSSSDADDAVQDTWLKLTGADPGEVENLAAWLTTVVARVSLNMLRVRRRPRPGPARWRRRPGRTWPAGRMTRRTRRCSPIRSAWRCWSCSTR
jgi:RNA polymerase sigma-70 factor (ECF subfamily)